MAADLIISLINHSNPDMLRDCIRSIYGTTCKITFEIVVVDNSTGGRLVDEIRGEFPAVRWIFNARRKGFSANHNQVLATNTARYACILNDDMIVHDGAFDALVEFMDTHPRAGMAGAKLLNADGSIQNCTFHDLTLWSELLGNYILPHKLCHLKAGIVHPAQYRGENAIVNWVLGACIIVRSEVLTQVGLLDAELSPIANTEEVDLVSGRTVKAGWQVWHVPAARITHFGGQSLKPDQVGPNLFYIEMMRTRVAYFRKHSGILYALLYRLLLALSLPWNTLALVAGQLKRRAPLSPLRPEIHTMLLITRMSLLGWVPPFARDESKS